jgi:hypothetical protein
MKNLLTYFLIVSFMMLGNSAFSQLPSERPMSAIAPKLLKDGPPKEQPLAGDLPSNKKMPEVNAPKGRTVPKRKMNTKVDPDKLPINSKKPI